MLRIKNKFPVLCFALAMPFSGGASLALDPPFARRSPGSSFRWPWRCGWESWKLAGAVVLPLPKRWRRDSLADWTYAGFLFLLSGAVLLHVAAGDAVAQVAAPLLLLALAAVAYALELRTRAGAA